MLSHHIRARAFAANHQSLSPAPRYSRAFDSCRVRRSYQGFQNETALTASKLEYAKNPRKLVLDECPPSLSATDTHARDT